MNRLRLLAIGMLLALAVPALTQQPATASTQQLPSVEQHLDALSQRLGLTSEQKDRARPVVQHMQDAMQSVLNDSSLTNEQRHEQIEAIHADADKQLRTILTEEQKKTLDALESEIHH
jgi:hypothetical protein